MLRLFLTLLGETAMVRLMEDAPVRVEAKAELDTTGTSYLGPFKTIALEADQLRQVSERLETLTDTPVGVDELMSVAGNIRNIAAVLDVSYSFEPKLAAQTTAYSSHQRMAI